MERKTAWEKYTKKELEEVFEFAEGYKAFISKCKTERECVNEIVKEAQEFGFSDINDIIKNKGSLKPGDKVYFNNRGKALAMFVIGKNDIEEGMNILGAHIDSPRLDLKQNPLYEDTGLTLMDTHYYGGIKKYQWVTLPLALHGIVATKSGEDIEINIGEDENDPVFGVSDLLIHLAADQMDKKASKVIEGEELDILVGSIPLKDEEKDAVKKNILDILKKQYNIEEDDFISAEIEAVPAGCARDYGFDKSMIMGYGQDDRVCAYPSYKALFEMKEPQRTCVCLLVDKEEVGSIGATGMQSRFFENSVVEVMELMGCFSNVSLRRAFSNSKALSSDVSAAFDPNFPSVSDKKNTAYFGKGMVLNKYTGSRGKSGSNDSCAEYVRDLRNIFDKSNVMYQTAELGKVDQGGGGTIAYILGNLNMYVIDSGVGVMNMHAPWEITSKADIFEAFKGYVAFLEN